MFEPPKRPSRNLRRALRCAALALTWFATAVATDYARNRQHAFASTTLISAFNLVEFTATPGRGFVVLATNRRVVHSPRGRAVAYTINAVLGALILFEFLRRREKLHARKRAAVASHEAQRNGTIPDPISPRRYPSRRAFILDAASAATLTIGAGAGVKALALDPWDLRTERYRFPLRNLSPDLENLRILLVADIHLGPRVSAHFAQRAVAQSIKLQPDIVILGGDYIDRRETPADVAALFQPLLNAFPNRVAGVLGNHDWYGDARGISRALTAIGVTMIDNDRVYIGADKRLHTAPQPGAICLAGLGDLEMDRIDVPRALRDAPETMPRIVMAHEPDTAEIPELKADTCPRIDLMLSGHTHGGQVRLPFLGTPIVPSRYGDKYAGGLVQAPQFPVIVSRGVGMSILPIRWNVPPELVEITLTRA